MNKTELTNQLASRLSIKKNTSGNIIDTCIDILSQTLQNGEGITLQGFGVFTPWQQVERLGRNPRTGEGCPIPPRTSVKFKPGKLLLKNMNGK